MTINPCTSVLAMALVCLLSVPARAGEPDIALSTLDFDSVASSYDQAQIRHALIEALGKRLRPIAVAEPTARPPERATDDRSRMQLGKRYATRLLVEASIFHGPAPSGGPPQWVAELSLFDSEGGEFVGTEDLHCTNCDLEPFLAGFPDLISRLLKHDHHRSTGRLAIHTKPATIAKISIDGRPLGYLPFEESLFAGNHQVVVEAKGYHPARVNVTLQPGARQEITLPLDRIDGEKPQPLPQASSVDGMKLLDPDFEPHVSPALRITGAVLIPVGAAGIIAGAALLALNGDPACNLPAGHTHCAERYNNTAVGTPLLVGGILAVAGGITALVIDAKHRRAVQLKPTAGAGLGRVTVGVEGVF